MIEHVYRHVDGHDLKLQVFAPASGDRGPCPAIVLFFGGGFVGGSIEQFHPQCRYFSTRGMVAIAADYRVKERHRSTPPDSAADGRAALRWVRAHAGALGIDPARVVAGGSSAGGGVATCTGLVDEPAPVDGRVTPSRADALVLFNPVLVTAAVDRRDIRPADRRSLYIERWGRDEIPEISAYHLADADAPPTLILHGEDDAICPVHTVRLFAAKLRDLGVRCDLAIWPGEGHGFFNYHRSRPCFIATLAEADRFLASLGYLRGEPTVEAWVAEADQTG
ncbi:MAG: alpha/beta hydrolase [Planctomycetota bacterium]